MLGLQVKELGKSAAPAPSNAPCAWLEMAEDCCFLVVLACTTGLQRQVFDLVTETELRQPRRER